MSLPITKALSIINSLLARQSVTFFIRSYRVAPMRTYSKPKSKQSRELGLATPNILELARFELSRRRSLRLQVSGSSMKPNINDGDYVTVETAHPSSVRIGDIILIASSSNTALIHRVARIEQKGGVNIFVTHADASSFQDVPVPFSQFLGRVTSIEKKDGLVNLNSPFNRLKARLQSLWKRFRRT